MDSLEIKQKETFEPMFISQDQLIVEQESSQ